MAEILSAEQVREILQIEWYGDLRHVQRHIQRLAASHEALRAESEALRQSVAALEAAVAIVTGDEPLVMPPLPPAKMGHGWVVAADVRPPFVLDIEPSESEVALAELKRRLPVLESALAWAESLERRADLASASGVAYDEACRDEAIYRRKYQQQASAQEGEHAATG